MKKALVLLAIVAVGVCVMTGGAWAQDKPAAGAGQSKAAAADPITGDWDGTVQMPDGGMPFTLKLKLEGEKVAGEIGSQQGAVAITSGSFADGKLTISFTYVDGTGVSLSGALAEGQLSGSLNYGGGQMVTSWTAKKKAQ